jgi:hypothetical protein
MLVFLTINFFLQNATDFHSNKGINDYNYSIIENVKDSSPPPSPRRTLAYLGPRKWSPLALWKFREFNELPEIFDSRMNKALEPANKYLAIFRNPLLTIIGKCAAYISGAFVATLLLASLFEEGALLYVRCRDQ